MILSTHAIAGAALASLLPTHPALVIIIGFTSHFALDAIPHWDYPLRSISLKPDDHRTPAIGKRLLRDATLVTFDAVLGLALAVGLFATPASLAVVLSGAFAAMLPDALQIVHRFYPYEPLRTLQRFHEWIHSNRRLNWPIGVSSQLALVAVIAVANGTL